MPCSRHADSAFRYRHFDQDIIVLCVRWYMSYRLSYRDLVEMMAKAFFRKALENKGGRPPRKVTLDGHVPSYRALRLLRREDRRWRQVHVRTCKYLTNIDEQDHRAIKRRITGMMGFKAFHSASVTLSGLELAHRIHKGQFALGRARGARRFNMRAAWDRAVFGAK